MAVKVLRKGVVPPPEAAICPTCKARVMRFSPFANVFPAAPATIAAGYSDNNTFPPVDAVFSCDFCGCVWKWNPNEEDA